MDCFIDRERRINKINSRMTRGAQFCENVVQSVYPEFFAVHRNCSSLEPTKVLYSGNRTIVFWNDGDKTIVKCAEGQVFDEYNGFVAALAKKMYGSTSKVKKIIDKTKKNQD